jgi:hypothetical protein
MTSSQSRRVLLEVPVTSVDDAVAAQKGGADRLELNADMERVEKATSDDKLKMFERRKECRRLQLVATEVFPCIQQALSSDIPGFHGVQCSRLGESAFSDWA